MLSMTCPWDRGWASLAAIRLGLVGNEESEGLALAPFLKTLQRLWARENVHLAQQRATDLAGPRTCVCAAPRSLRKPGRGRGGRPSCGVCGAGSERRKSFPLGNRPAVGRGGVVSKGKAVWKHIVMFSVRVLPRAPFSPIQALVALIWWWDFSPKLLLLMPVCFA